MKTIKNLIGYLSIYGLIGGIAIAYAEGDLIGIDAQMGINAGSIVLGTEHDLNLRYDTSAQSAATDHTPHHAAISANASTEFDMLGINTGIMPESGVKLKHDDSPPSLDSTDALLVAASPDTTEGLEMLDINGGMNPLTPDLGLKLKHDDTVNLPDTIDTEIVLAGVSGNPNTSAAPERLGREEYVVGQGFGLGPGELEPELKLKLRYDDNLTFSEGETIGSFVTLVTPSIAYNIIGKTKEYKVEYQIDAGFHEASSVDDYIDNRIRTSFDYDPTSRIYTQTAAEFLDSRDPRGEGRAEGGQGIIQDSPDEWHRWKLGGRFAYGARTAKGRIELETDYFTKRYDSNRETTFVRDLDQMDTKGRFFYRIRPKTSLLLEGRIAQFDYKRDAPGEPSLDSTNLQLLAGATWFATYKTTGFLKLGFIKKEFDSSRQEGSDGFSWEIGVDWERKTYSTVSFETIQRFAETDGTGNAIDQTQTNLSWNHAWLSRLSTNLELSYIQESFNPDKREDEVFIAGAKLNYEFRRWLTFGAAYRYQTRTSSDPIFGFDRNIIEITADIKL